MTYAVLNGCVDVLRIMLAAGFDPNQRCAVIVGSFVMIPKLCIIATLHDDLTCDLAQSDGIISGTNESIVNVEVYCVSLLACAVLNMCLSVDSTNQASSNLSLY